MNSAIIHSNLSRSTQFLRLSDAAGLLMLMALTHCDDYGRIRAEADWWVINVCPGRKTLIQVEELIVEILSKKDKSGVSMLTPYTVGDEEFFYVTKWFKYQTIGSNYVAWAECPHPVVGVIEPNVMGKTLNANFAEMTNYNAMDHEVRIFLEQGKARSKSAQKEEGSAQKPPKSAQTNSESSQGPSRKDDNPSRPPGEIPKSDEGSAQIHGKSAEHPSRNGLSTASASSPSTALATASSPAPALALATSPGSVEPEIPPESGSPPSGVSLKSSFPGPESGAGPPTEGSLALMRQVLEPDNPGRKANLTLVLGKVRETAKEAEERERLKHLVYQTNLEAEISERGRLWREASPDERKILAAKWKSENGEENGNG